MSLMHLANKQIRRRNSPDMYDAKEKNYVIVAYITGAVRIENLRSELSVRDKTYRSFNWHTSLGIIF